MTLSLLNPRQVTDARILVVDDDLSNVELLTEVLHRAGYADVHGETDPIAAATTFLTTGPDAVFVDMHMPGCSGVDLIGKLRGEIEEGEYLPFVIVTGDPSAQIVDSALASGAKDFIAKPYRFEEVLLRLRNLLETRMLYLALRSHNSELQAQIRHHDRLSAEHEEKRHTVAGLMAAIARGENVLELVYQPVVDLRTGETRFVEALSRFSLEPRRTPDLWFADAATVGLGVDLELAAIDLALEGAATLPAGIGVSLNASPATVCSRELHERLDTVSEVPLVIELTEHDDFDDEEAIRGALGRLKGLGIRFALDDTGSGFSSLSQILRLGPDLIKLDRMLITGIDTDAARRALVEAMVRFSEEVGAELIAEGVETRDELLVVQHLGVQLAQGYYLARPGPLPLSKMHFELD